MNFLLLEALAYLPYVTMTGAIVALLIIMHRVFGLDLFFTSHPSPYPIGRAEAEWFLVPRKQMDEWFARRWNAFWEGLGE